MITFPNAIKVLRLGAGIIIRIIVRMITVIIIILIIEILVYL
jgi:hypothetical protein